MCVLAKLKIASAVMGHMELLRDLDGQQTNGLDGIKAR